jgi:OmcA/MtrC family decaheme c-type cytochrome
MAGRWGCVASFCTEQYDYYADNPVTYVAITDPAPVPRRAVVAIEKCNACHEHLEIHGGSRNNPELCAMCHNSTFDTIDRMPVPTGTQVETRSLSLANFIHRVHTGHEGESPAVFWGPRPSSPINAGGNPADFGHVRFPADRRVCDRCHVDISTAQDLDTLTTLRAPRTRLIDDTRTVLETYTVGRTASACNGCHDSAGAIAHAETMTTALGEEGCAACHSAGDAFGVDTVHARPTYDIR